MTHLPRKISDAVNISREQPNFAIGEDAGSLQVICDHSASSIAAWQAVSNDQRDWLTVNCFNSINDEVRPSDIAVGENARLQIRFDETGKSRHIFTLEGWRTFLLAHSDEVVTDVFLAFVDAGFSTLEFRVHPWTDDQLTGGITPQTADNSSEPRRYVRFQSADFMPPYKIERWLLDGQGDGLAFDAWMWIANEMLVLCIVNELYVDNGEKFVALTGLPPRRLIYGEIASDEVLFDNLQTVAKWVYVEGSDVETRHNLLTGELAREWSEQSFCGGIASKLEPALNSARLLYQAHLRAGSRDTLKTLADMRKGLADDVQSLTKQARELSTGVWRDIAIAIGVVAVRVASAGTDSNGPVSYFGFVYAAVAAYILVSFWIITSTNRHFMDASDNLRAVWKQKLYAFLDQEDYDQMASEPMLTAKQAYRKTKNAASAIVYITFSSLLLLAAHECDIIDLSALIASGAELFQSIKTDIANRLETLKSPTS